MSVRNIIQGYYNIESVGLPTSLNVTGAITGTINVEFYELNGSVQLHIPSFNQTSTASSYISATIPSQFLAPGSTEQLIFYVIINKAGVQNPASITLNMGTGEMRIYADLFQVGGWEVSQICGLFYDATLIWNIV